VARGEPLMLVARVGGAPLCGAGRVDADDESGSAAGGGGGAGQCRGTEALLFYDSSARARGLWCCCCSFFVARALPNFLREHTVRGCSLRFALFVMCSLAENVCFGRFAHLLLRRVHCTPGRDTTPD